MLLQKDSVNESLLVFQCALEIGDIMAMTIAEREKYSEDITQLKVHHTMFMISCTDALHISPFATEKEILEKITLLMVEKSSLEIVNSH